MRSLLVWGVLAVLVVTLTSAVSGKRQMSDICRKIRRNGCSAALKGTGKVCGTDGKTYNNRCLLQKKACKLKSNLQVAVSAPCEETPQRQAAGGTGGEETVIGVGGGENEPGDTPDQPDAPEQDEPGDTPDGTDAPDQPDAPEQIEPGDTPDQPDAPEQNEPGDTPDGADEPDTPDQQDPGAQAADPTVPAVPPGTGGPAVGGGSSSSAGSSSSEEAGAGGAGGAGAGGAGTMAPATETPPISPSLKVCPESCPVPLESDQVCGTDGETYRSTCLMQQYVCDTNDTVTVEHPGPCNNTCGEPCSLVYEPVCGTDDLTYMSRCDLLRTACLTMDDTLRVAYNGECSGVALLKECQECDPYPEPVCSTNNMTFRSECEFERFVCIFDVRGIEIAFNGSCPDALLVCPNYCEQIDDPVCASDGITYPNICEVGTADCHAKQTDPTASVTFKTYGECLEGTADPCAENNQECELIEGPVCATKGREQVTYANKCIFDKEVCVDRSIKFVKYGRCSQPNAPVQ